MSVEPLVLALDQGTTSTRALLFGSFGNIIRQSAEPLEQICHEPGWVEHDPEEIWRACLSVCRTVLDGVGADRVAALGIANQRETTVVWDRATGEPVGNAIVWQDRRTAPLCETLREEGLAAHVRSRTGLVIDPYFSATKIAWLLDRTPGLRDRAARGEILFGTIDTWLIWKLTAGRMHATDATNASRTMLFDIDAGEWDQVLLDRLDIPRAMLPEVRPSQADFGVVEPALLGAAVPIRGVAGDQQAAAYGQCCFEPGQMKATFGTGCFMLATCGAQSPRSRHGLLTTILIQIENGRSYALEGAIFMAGATIQWLRDALGLIATAAESEALALQASARSGVALVPAFQGLGAPHWDATARGAIVGLSRASGRADIVRAGLESVAFQTRDLLGAMTSDLEAAGLPKPGSLRVDGGMTQNRWLMQFLADSLRLPIEVAAHGEATALGTAFLAGQAVGVYPGQPELSRSWRAAAIFEPVMAENEAESRYGDWLQAVERVRSARQP